MTNTKKIRDEIIRKIKSKENREVLGNFNIKCRNHYKKSCIVAPKYWTWNQFTDSREDDCWYEANYYFSKTDYSGKQYWRIKWKYDWGLDYTRWRGCPRARGRFRRLKWIAWVRGWRDWARALSELRLSKE